MAKWKSLSTVSNALLRFRAIRKCFESDNPKYQAIEVSREEHPYPILGVFVGVV